MKRKIILMVTTLVGVTAAVQIALARGETIHAAWLIAVALSVYIIAYQTYGRWVAYRVLQLDGQDQTPAHRLSDGIDYVPLSKGYLFGHHFAGIAGAGPLIGPVLAAQLGYLPGLLWILGGVVFAGAVHDFVILVASVRRDGKTLGEMIRQELGGFLGGMASIGIVMIMIILLAVLSLVVVKAVAHSPWALFTIAATMPIAILMGAWLRFRPQDVLMVSAIGFVLLMVAVIAGGQVAAIPKWAALLTLEGTQLAWCLIGYGFVASVLPVWILLAPRDYLSTFLKIGTILALAVGIIWVGPFLKMPALTRFMDGTGPVFSGQVFPFLFITIACGAISGFHSLVASGTTPKMLDQEPDALLIGYGAMLMESMVAVMALITASILEPGLYFAMNSPAALIGNTAQSAAQAISEWGFPVKSEAITQLAQSIQEETILSRTGGAPTLAVGMAELAGQIFGKSTMAFWYHFAILFEALFILTTVDAGTRVGRLMIQDLLGRVHPTLSKTDHVGAGMLATGLCVGGWGYFLYQGVIDPLGGINTLWPLFGMANQMLAGIALVLATMVIWRKTPQWWWVTGIPLVCVCLITLTAAYNKLWNTNPKIGFLAAAQQYQAGITRQVLIAPAKSVEQMSQIVMNNQINAGLTVLFSGLLISMVLGMLVTIGRSELNQE